MRSQCAFYQGITSTWSISSSASSVVSVSGIENRLDASFRLSCRACSSCLLRLCQYCGIGIFRFQKQLVTRSLFRL